MIQETLEFLLYDIGLSTLNDIGILSIMSNISTILKPNLERSQILYFKVLWRVDLKGNKPGIRNLVGWPLYYSLSTLMYTCVFLHRSDSLLTFDIWRNSWKKENVENERSESPPQTKMSRFIIQVGEIKYIAFPYQKTSTVIFDISFSSGCLFERNSLETPGIDSMNLYFTLSRET